MGVSDNAQRVSSPSIQREASHPSSNAVSKTSLGLQSHCLPKLLTWEINAEKTQKNQKCCGTCRGRMQTTERQAASLAVREAGEQRVQQRSCLCTTALQGCFPKLSHCLIDSRGVIRTTAVKITQHMLQRQSTDTHWWFDSSKCIHRKNLSFQDTPVSSQYRPHLPCVHSRSSPTQAI